MPGQRMTARTCVNPECGEDISKLHSNTKWCEGCKKENSRKRTQLWRDANRERHREYTRSWATANPEKKQENDRHYNRANKEKLRKQKHARYTANREEIRANQRVWLEVHKERVNAARRARHACNPERIRTRRRAWREVNVNRVRHNIRVWQKTNPAKVNERNRGRYALKRGLWGTVTKGITNILLQRQGNRCAGPGCGKCIGKRVNGKADHHLDHIIPLAAGGLHDNSNLQVLCVSCNLRKGAKDPLVFARERGLLL